MRAGKGGGGLEGDWPATKEKRPARASQKKERDAWAKTGDA